MDARYESSAEEVARLRDGLNDLASIMALPALSSGSEPGQIVSTLTDALLGMLRLAFVCVRVNDATGGPTIETMRIGDTLGETARSDVSFASAKLGLDGELGIVVAGSWRLDFPVVTERVLLDVAANQAAIGLQQARLLQRAGLRTLDRTIQSLAGSANEVINGPGRMFHSAVEMSQWPDFVKLAEAMGCAGVRLEDKTTLVDDLRAAMAIEGPVVVDARVTKEECVYPMIAPGQAARNMVG